MHFGIGNYGNSRRNSKGKRIKKLEKRVDLLERLLDKLIEHLDLSATNDYPFSDWGEWDLVEGRKKDD